MTGKCHYCDSAGKERIPGEDPTYVCDGCWKILQDPKTALPFLRGHITLELRGKVPESQLKQQIEIFMGNISKWRRPG
jgi:hypothetical protein